MPNNPPCPICKLPLLDNGDEFFCRNRIKIKDYFTIPHFELRDGTQGTWYVPPFKIIYADGKSDIYRLIDSNITSFSHKGDFEFIFSTGSELRPDDPVKMAKRIQQLIIFS